MRSPPVGNRRLPLVAHAAGLAVVLTCLLPFTRPGVAWYSDEGAAIVQSQLLARTGSWLLPPTLPEVDPEGDAQPFPNGDRGERGLAPYAKHPLYPLALAGAGRLLGPLGYLALSLTGTVLAALAAGLLARHFDPDVGRLSLWVVGLASPLFFDSYLVLAHTLAAAAAGFAVVLAGLASTTVGGTRPRAAQVAGCGVLIALATALRTEAAFVGIALALTAMAVAVGSRWPARAAHPSRSLPVVGGLARVAAACLFAVALVRVAEHLFLERLLGPRRVAAVSFAGGFLTGRLRAFVATWLDPSYDPRPAVNIALVLGAAAAAATAVLMRIGAPRRAVIGSLAVVAGAYLVRLAEPPFGPVPGLAVAFPLGTLALVAAAGRLPTGTSAVLSGGTALVATVLVLLTQHPIGGGVEWGGRYFAVVLPIAVPLLLSALVRCWPAGAAGRVATALVAAAHVALVFVAVASLARNHQVHRELFAAVDEAALYASGATGDPALVVSTERLLPQLAWDRFWEHTWLSPEPADLAGVGRRLAASGIERFVLVSPDPPRELAELAPGWVEATGLPPPRPTPVPVLVVESRLTGVP